MVPYNNLYKKSSRRSLKMDSNESPVIINDDQTNPNQQEQKEEEINKRLGDDCQEAEADSTIHGFNISNITVIEKTADTTTTTNLDNNTVINIKPQSCEGSDSGVEVAENCHRQRTLSINSTNSQEFLGVTSACSYESSLISCCSNYEEAYNLLARRNSTLLEDYKLSCDGTSEGGSESSSVAGSSNSIPSKRVSSSCTKKKLATNELKVKNAKISTPRSRSKPPVTPKNSLTSLRGKLTTEKSQSKTSNSKQESTKTSNTRTKPVPSSLTINSDKTENKKPAVSRGSSTTRTPISTPTDDGRWPSINSKPAPLMGRSMRGLITAEGSSSSSSSSKRCGTNVESKFSSVEKYATLPRRRKEKSADSLPEQSSKSLVSKDNRNSTVKKQTSRESVAPKSLPPYPRKKNLPKIKIYHEISSQTAITHTDIEKAFSGITCSPARPQDVEMCEKEVQVDENSEKIEKLEEKLKILTDNHEKLLSDYRKQSEDLNDIEQRLKEERLEKDGLKEELRQNTERVLAILGNDTSLPEDESSGSDSLLVLETRYQKVGQIVIKQENEISELNAYCRSLQRDLDKSIAVQKALLQQQQDLEVEGIELQEFMQAEKSTLTDALKEAETELKRLNSVIAQKDKEIEAKQDESKRLVRVSEQRRQENMGLQARLGAFEARTRELLIYQGGHISGAAVALSALISRLDGLVEELVTCYSISEQELEDVIFHNEAYTNSSSSPDATPEKNKKVLKEKSPSPKRGSSFVSAIINAIKNATSQTPFSNSKELSKDTISMDNSDSIEMLDSETEPCLMMEPVLEDVVIPDGHSHNMISSGHGMLNSARLTHSESLNNLSQAILHRQISEQASMSLAESLNTSYTSEMSSLTELCPLVPLVDQVIEVDNLVTKLLKVLRIIQIENDDCMNELQDEKDHLSELVGKQKEANIVVVKQLKDWEILGAHLKSEVTELMQQLSRKNKEIDDLKSELNQHRKEIERLNEDVCALSTACSKAELELKMKNEETTESIKKWEETGEIPSTEVLGKLLTAHNELPILKERLEEKEKQLTELKQEFLDSRHVLSENWKEAIGEAKKQYEAIDSALEILHSIQTVVQQCPPLAKLQRDLEETSFQSASSMPIVNPSDCNANGALLKSVNNLEIPSPINSTA
ncbi:hypothetical protein ILUMI_20844 [Ignelater luminosus]|uniref:Uncharacterized protein n=1 Tax=Ignelater luminosus TaxID=2038154 RepID=A0A8K0G1Y4_IGNLU|nr:hypothetical protein ILUMI_20844 [Ignelater luminosus]